jgi:hypothetical protein
MSQRTLYIFGIVLIAVLSVSIAAAIDWLGNVNSVSEFYVGVEFAYDGSSGDSGELLGYLKAMVDKVKDYTNLFVIGSIEITFNQTALDEACDYVVGSGLNLIVFFTDSQKYNYTVAKDGQVQNSSIFEWIVEAKQKYSDKFLGVYRYDEPGGNQLDQGPSVLIENGTSYSDVANRYTSALGQLIAYYLNSTDKVFTADYGLYWFDYDCEYTAVFTEFGWNHSRPLHIGLCRSAAEAHNKDWGAIVTWEYKEEPYIESGEELYNDMILAYKTGAKYVVIFNYAPNATQYGTLTEKHFGAIKDFWNYVNSNPRDYGVIKGEAAYVLPKDYGFGFRRPDDKIWGLWNADDLSPKVFDDTNLLLLQYASRLDIVYDDAEFIGGVRSRYDNLFFWNETVS